MADDNPSATQGGTARTIAFLIIVFFAGLMVGTGYMAWREQSPFAVEKAAENTLQASQKLMGMAQETLRTFPNGEAKFLETIETALDHLREMQTIINALRDSDNQFWAELFKTGLLLVGGSLTSAVGYYFGNQGVDAAQRSAEQAQQMADVANRETKRAEELADQLAKANEELKAAAEAAAPTADEAVPGIVAVDIKDP